MDVTILGGGAMAKCIYIAYMVGISSIVSCIKTKTMQAIGGGFAECICTSSSLSSKLKCSNMVMQ